MKITFILAQNNLSGGVRIIAQYASRLQRRGHDVVVVTRPPRKRSLRERTRALLHDGKWPETRVLGESYFDGSGVKLRELDSFRPVGEEDVPDADVVIATFWTTAHWVESFSPRKGTKVLFIQGYEAPLAGSNPDLDATWRMPLQKIVISPWLQELAVSKFGDSRSILVHNGVDATQFFAPPRGKQEIPRVGVLYATSPEKGLDISLAALSRAREEVPSIRLISFGATRQVRSLPLGHQSQFLYRPPQSHLREIYASCDAWLFGSRREGFGLPILEAMACRTPLIGVRTGVVPELLKGGGGITVAPEDPEDMARAIVSVCRMPPDRWKAMSDAALATALKFTCDEAVGLFENALRTAMERQAEATGDPGASITRQGNP